MSFLYIRRLTMYKVVVGLALASAGVGAFLGVDLGMHRFLVVALASAGLWLLVASVQ